MPQFRGVFHPVLIALGAAIALVAVRIRLGRGGALVAVAFFWVARLALTGGILAFERSTQHIPLYVAEALLVEVVAARVGRDRQLTLGAVAGALIGTVGFAVEWGWSQVWMPQPWRGDLLPEAVPLVVIAGVGGGILGGCIGRALAPSDVGRQEVPRLVAPAAWLGVAAVLGICLPMTEATDWEADLRMTPAGVDGDTGADRVDLIVALDDESDRAARDAAWFQVIAWQGAGDGGPGGFEYEDMERQPDGTWRSAQPIPVGGSFKTLLRLHAGDGMQAVPIYLAADEALDAEEIPAVDGTRAFQREKSILQREAKTDKVGLERLAYAALAGVAIAWMATLSWGMGRLSPTGTPPANRRARRGTPSTLPQPAAGSAG